MKKQILKTAALIALFFSIVLVYGEAQAQTLTEEQSQDAVVETTGIQDAKSIDELDPSAENIEEILQEMDREYLRQTGELPYIMPIFTWGKSCQRYDCTVYAEVRKSEQKIYVYVNGALTYNWLVSTGAAPKNETPLWEGHPNGRIYDKYSSKANPGGDYKGLGNMPYAVFLHGGYAVHGTTEGNFKHLGKKASHGCVRMHPDNGFIFNRLVRQYGIAATWVSIIE